MADRSCPDCGSTEHLADPQLAPYVECCGCGEEYQIVWCPSCGDESPRTVPHACPQGTVPYEAGDR